MSDLPMIVIDVNGYVATTVLPTPHLESLQHLVGGNIEKPSGSLAGIPISIVVNESGLLRPDPEGNHTATSLLNRAYGPFTHTLLVGRAVLIQIDDNGNDVGFTDEQLAAVAEALHLDSIPDHPYDSFLTY